LSPGCRNCWAARAAGTLQTSTDNPLHSGTTILKGGRHIYTGHITELSPGHQKWREPRKGADELFWVADMSELFLPERSKEVIDRTIGTLAMSNHFVLILTKLPEEMAAYFNAQPAIIQQRWRKKFLLGFSAENPEWFDRRWPPMRALAQAGWFIFVSIAPMLAPVTLPDDLLTLGKRCWVICSGEEGSREHVRYMSSTWARAVRDQCRDAGIPFFLKQMSGEKPIPPDLFIREFPAL
jgi:protein gp37